MNVNSMINKSLMILANKGEFYKYNTFKFYSEQTNRYSTKHQLLHRRLVAGPRGISERYSEVETSYNNRDILQYLMKEIKRMG